MVSVSFFSSPPELCNLGFVHSFQILFSTCEMFSVCVCISDSCHKQKPNIE